MDKLEIKHGSFIQQTQYFIPVEVLVILFPSTVLDTVGRQRRPKPHMGD
jgi:hypothetical protein